MKNSKDTLLKIIDKQTLLRGNVKDAMKNSKDRTTFREFMENSWFDKCNLNRVFYEKVHAQPHDIINRNLDVLLNNNVYINIHSHIFDELDK